MKLKKIKERLDKEGYFWAFVCPSCGEINEKLIIEQEGHIDDTIKIINGRIKTVSTNYDADNYLGVYMCDCGDSCSDYSAEELKVIVKRKNGKIYVVLMCEKLSDKDIAFIKEAIEEKYGGKIEVDESNEYAITEDDANVESDVSDVKKILENWR